MSGVSALSRAVMLQPGRLWKSYIKKLDKSPIATKMATSMCAAVMGDAFAQRVSRPKAPVTDWEYDWLRTARLCAFNAGMGCLGHFYYGALDRSVMVHAPTTPRAIVTKVAIDQLIFAPLCTLLFYAYKCSAEGRPSEYVTELHSKYIPTLQAGWKLWPAAHIINFAFVPTQHRILYLNVVSLAGTYLLSRAAAGDFSSAASSEDNAGRPNEVLFDGVHVKVY